MDLISKQLCMDQINILTKKIHLTFICGANKYFNEDISVLTMIYGSNTFSSTNTSFKQ